SDLLAEETDAYRAQFSFDENSIIKHVPSYIGRPDLLSQINSDWITGINTSFDMTGEFIYAKMLMGVHYNL
ncbi:hypothetical protein OZK63_42705, partial [Streptomyces sp. UMAF16]|nr:hypothetical protein [Streptomyces sp. UMAF16]